jgi:hypothetical protein
MKTPGCITVNRSLLKTLGNIMVLSTVSLTSFLVGAILVESISGRYESLEVKVGELEVKATGRDTTAAVMSLMTSVKRWGTMPLNETY